MSKTKRTPAPWQFMHPDQVRGPEQEFVADCCCNVPSRREKDSANAELCSLAPVLLEQNTQLREGLEHAIAWFLAAGLDRQPGGAEALAMYRSALSAGGGAFNLAR